MEELLKRLENISSLIKRNKLRRILHAPSKYFTILRHNKLAYSIHKKPLIKETKTFFNSTMNLALPASTDLYIWGAKTHHSEIRLAKFLLDNLKPNHCFVDVGAHFGYFSLLGAKICQQGKVHAFDASPSSFKLLQKNTESIQNIYCYNYAVSSKKGEIYFYEFPTKYSEYNALNAVQYENETWYASNKPKKIELRAIALSEFFNEKNIHPNIIKMDVEGAEKQIIEGLLEYLSQNDVQIVMEYLYKKEEISSHDDAVNLLKSLSYLPHCIEKSGKTRQIKDLRGYMAENDYQSDNIVFKKN